MKDYELRVKYDELMQKYLELKKLYYTSQNMLENILEVYCLEIKDKHKK